MKNNFLISVNAFRVKHEPEILMSMGLAGLCFSVAWGIKTTVKAVKVCEKRKEELKWDKLPAKEVLKLTWKMYLPVAVSTLASVPCIIAGNRVSSKRNAALAAAYAISETALREYQDKTKEIIGEEKEKEIRTAIAQDKVDKDKESKEIVFDNDEEQLFYEPLSGRYFKSTWNNIVKAVNELNEEALGSVAGGYYLNDLYERLGLDGTELGAELGWCVPCVGLSFGLLKVRMCTTITKDDKPCGCIEFIIKPYPID